jgi:hypothetical protein
VNAAQQPYAPPPTSAANTGRACSLSRPLLRSALIGLARARSDRRGSDRAERFCGTQFYGRRIYGKRIYRIQNCGTHGNPFVGHVKHRFSCRYYFPSQTSSHREGLFATKSQPRIPALGSCLGKEGEPDFGLVVTIGWRGNLSVASAQSVGDETCWWTGVLSGKRACGQDRISGLGPGQDRPLLSAQLFVP